jgi:hypothetical protein
MMTAINKNSSAQEEITEASRSVTKKLLQATKNFCQHHDERVYQAKKEIFCSTNTNFLHT